MGHWGGNDTCVDFVSLWIIRKVEHWSLLRARTHAHTHTHINLTRFPVLVVSENNGLYKAAVWMQKFHVAILKGKIFSTNTTKQENGVTASPILNPGNGWK